MTRDIQHPRIAVDAMGGDHGPSVAVPGAVAALRDGADCRLSFYGNPAAIEAELSRLDVAGLEIAVVPCTQDIAMCESPAAAVRGKPDSPIVKAMQAQRHGEVDAVVSAGSTGAMVAASLLILGRLGNAERPAIATFIPTVRGETLLLDAGANPECSPELLLSFARMGEAYCRALRDNPAPSIGLLNIGSEPSKGNDLAVAAHRLLADAGFNFHGNVEGNEVLVGPCDVLVADGFTGNIALKMCEGLATFLKTLAASGQLSGDQLAGLMAFAGVVKGRFNYEVYGGAPLLGVRGISIICHGRSSALAFEHAVKVADRQVRCDLPGLIDQALDTRGH
ncbi:MAG: phosphate acyltransferase PlsX [Candidatus Krumholzibacteriia bacterium]